jgi:hypothetical protein
LLRNRQKERNERLFQPMDSSTKTGKIAPEPPSLAGVNEALLDAFVEALGRDAAAYDYRQLEKVQNGERDEVEPRQS